MKKTFGLTLNGIGEEEEAGLPSKEVDLLTEQGGRFLQMIREQRPPELPSVTKRLDVLDKVVEVCNNSTRA